MSPRRFEGWEPTEVHEHFDENGHPCRAADAFTTVVTREAEWDEVTQQRALELGEYEAGLCGCGCGRPAKEAYQKKAYRVKHFTCAAGRAIALAKLKEAEEAENLKKPDGWNAGRHYYAEPVEVDDG